MGFSQYIALLLSLSLSSVGEATSRCRCLYGQPCWPSDSAFSALATQLTQPLIHPVPPASACYPPSSPSGNCSDVIAHNVDEIWRADQAGALQNTNFESFVFPNGTVDACYLNVALGFPCEQGSVPPIGVDARSAGDIQAAVKFAKRNNLRLVVKNTGHDYLGRSAGRGGFMVWTHNLKDKVYNPSFVPEGAPANAKETFNAVTFGAGVQWIEAYSFVQQQGRFIVGGISLGGSVGSAGGWVMGAGHSAFAPSFGLGVDNVLQFTIVLANGQYITANAHQHPDLFWALRGGGGGTYGIVVSATYKTHPIFPVTMFALVANFTAPNIAQEVVTEFVKLHPAISDAGWGGYTGISNTNFQTLFVRPNTSEADANSTFSHLLGVAYNATGGSIQTATLTYPTFLDWYTTWFSSVGQVGSRVEIASRLLPHSFASQNPATAAKIMLSIDGGVATNSVAGGAVSRVDPSSTGLNPSWRNAIAQVYVTAFWPEGSSATTIQAAIDRLKKNTDVIDKLTTDSGSYLNEGSLHEHDFKKSFFGAHYSKLKDIKAKYDPSSLFVVALGVGSDDWDQNLQCLR
ncbi:hypothetical protein GALMADRAFT_213094 [Galerina marginata CBS 339.88]|uniref:FAD-binding PCMH-type domain-containing protein n=1 Tax=Galerina marginata (strain CBS 339.88) TaxID=685588 RepID=A0A067SXZ0_GALM3|nr:hypothetical protein GALMADRAFT_213094 [Galerina marginata CBS 339.88]